MCCYSTQPSDSLNKGPQIEECTCCCACCASWFKSWADSCRPGGIFTGSWNRKDVHIITLTLAKDNICSSVSYNNAALFSKTVI